MKLSNFIDGLKLLSQHFDNPAGYHVGAEHDQFYVYATDKPLTEADWKRLKELGWFQEGHSEEPEFYDAGEGWTCFT
jgi:hypothetical protein